MTTVNLARVSIYAPERIRPAVDSAKWLARQRLRYRFIKLRLAATEPRPFGKTATASLLIRRKRTYTERRKFLSVRESAWEGSTDDRRLVVVVGPEQEETANSSQLLHSIRLLHPSVQQLCLALMDGATLPKAAMEAGLSDTQVAFVLPRLRAFFAPLVGYREAAE